VSTDVAGNPRAPQPVPLENAAELGIQQVLDRDGAPAGNLADPGLSREEVRMLYGRIAFWIPLRGQEALQVAATHAMDPRDWIFRDHRTISPWLMRGASLSLLFAQLFGAESEPQKGRRLPCLIGNRAVNVVQGPTQVGSFISHACGVAWAARLKGSDTKVLCMFGDGASSRGEFHSAMNFAGIHRPPVIFLCVNNSWAVSTPLDRQTALSEFAAKGNAYDVPNLRVDGNDLLAVYSAMKKARERTATQGPTLIEAVTWRLGFHTSSDNPDLYRHQQENQLWEPWDPIPRTRKYLALAGWWSESDEEELLKCCADRIQAAVEQAENMDIPGPESQFEDVFEKSHWMLEEQRESLLAEIGSGDQ